MLTKCDNCYICINFYIDLFILNVFCSFKKINIKLVTKLNFYYFVMTKIVRNILNVLIFKIVNKKLFFIISCTYEFHKLCYLTTIKIKIIICQHDNKKINQN